MELWKQEIRHIDMAATSSQTGKTVAVRDEPVLETPSSPSSLSSGSQAEHEFEYLESDNVATQEDIPPDGGYGWVVTACVFIINAHTWGINSVRTEPPIQKQSYSHEVSIADQTVMGCIPGALPVQFDIPWGHRAAIRLNRRPLDIPSPARVTSRVAIEPQARNSTNTTDRNRAGVWLDAIRLICNQDLAPVPQPRRVFRLRHGLPVHHSNIDPAQMVRETTQSGAWDRLRWCWYRWSGV